jgi:hypothetical protein
MFYAIKKLDLKFYYDVFHRYFRSKIALRRILCIFYRKNS